MSPEYVRKRTGGRTLSVNSSWAGRWYLCLAGLGGSLGPCFGVRLDGGH